MTAEPEVAPRPDHTAAAGLLHPVPILGMLVLGLNDHWGKAAFPGLLTGKISDFAGLVFFPLLLQAGWEVVSRRASQRAALVTAAVATGVVFTLTKTLPVATQVWAWTLGVLQWPALAIVRDQARPVPVVAMCDPTDLVALPMLGVAVWVGWGRGKRSPGSVSAGGAPRSDR